MDRRSLRRFRDEGWVRVGGLVPRDVCATIREAFDREVRPHTGPLRRQLTSREEPHRLSADGLVTNPIVNPRLLSGFPELALSEERVMRAGPLVAWASALLGADPCLLQSAYYDSSAGTLPHVDTNPVDRDRPMLGAWIALEDIGPDAGRFFLWPGSHRLPDEPRVRRYRELAWASYRSAFVELLPSAVEAEAQELLVEIARAHGLERTTPPLRAGDAVFWTHAVVHGSEVPRPGGGSRSSLVLHFVELELARRVGLATDR